MRSLLSYVVLCGIATSLHAASLPTVVTLPATQITATSATLNGTVDANGARTKASFEFGATSGYGSSITAVPSRVSNPDGTTTVTAGLTGLSCGTAYHFRVRGTNRIGTARGSDEVFTTAACPTPAPVAPAARTTAPTSVTATSATLNGAVTPGSATATVSFDWGTTTAYGNVASASPATLAASAAESTVSAALPNLTCGTTYHFRARAVSSAGSGTGSNQSFTTLACATPAAPQARTTAASAVSATGATLNGAVTPGSSAATVTFEWGPTTAYGTTASASPATLAASTSESAVAAALTGLACGSTYHFRVKAVGSAGSAVGADQSFATASCGTPQPPACSSTTVHCVSATARAEQEFSTIQAAVNVAMPGDTVLVHDGSYAGFVASRSGTSTAPITIRAQGSAVVVDRPSSAGEGIRVSNASYVVVEGFTVTGISGYGIAARGATATSPMHGVVFRDNTVRNGGTTNIYASQAANSLIEGNISTGSGEHGIYLANGGADNTVIRGNLVANNAVAGIHMNGDSSQGGDGLQTGTILDGNIVHSNGLNGISMDGVQSATLRNNLVYGNARHGVRAFRIDGTSGPKSLVFVNNTIVAASGNTSIKVTEDFGGHTFFNNVLVNEGSSGGTLIVGGSSIASNHNTFVNAGFSVNGGSTMLGLSGWRSLGFDVGSATSTQGELFVAAASRDYRLSAGAVAANAGVASFNGKPAPALDIADRPRPAGTAHDHGAHETF